jgi:hypothetical protein
MKRTIVSILLVPGLLAVVLLALSAPSIINSIQGPSDDPSLLCRSADPSPVAEASDAQLVLQACAAGKTFTIRRGETIAVDLTGSGDVDTSGTFHDLSVSDSSILGTIVGPRTIYLNSRGGTQGRFFDYFAVYIGVRSGQATISAVLNTCVNAGCHDTNRWRATVRVT